MPVKLEFDTIDDVVRDIVAGKIVIVTDDADRENEGDLVMAAEKATPKAINFMAMHGRGFGATRLAAELHLSVKTIETHQMRIKEKLGLRSAAELSKEASLWMSEIARRELATSR